MFPCMITEEPIDYTEVTRILSFAACETRQCVNIMFDMVNETVEEFGVTLERTMGLSPTISLQPVDARVIINDDIECKSALLISNINSGMKQITSYQWVIALASYARLLFLDYTCLLNAFIHCLTTV